MQQLAAVFFCWFQAQILIRRSLVRGERRAIRSGTKLGYPQRVGVSCQRTNGDKGRPICRELYKKRRMLVVSGSCYRQQCTALQHDLEINNSTKCQSPHSNMAIRLVVFPSVSDFGFGCRSQLHIEHANVSLGCHRGRLRASGRSPLSFDLISRCCERHAT